jgi:regulator of protease activity HflC (stomatin/prohibitin superfamily)
MRSGDMVKAGIGLRTFKGPFDQVAKFPAKIHRVTFSTENVTKEMQGIKVSGMLVWTILRTGDGPFQAFKNLGTDLATNNPHTANEALVSMSSAIVRSCIANSTIHEMLTDREHIRSMMQKEMFNVVKGWGVWVETFEVSSVVISSSSLFRDLQTNYREKVRKDAEICKMEFRTDLKAIEQQYEAKQAKFRREIDEQREIYRQKIDIEINAKREENNLALQALEQEIGQIQLDFNVYEA